MCQRIFTDKSVWYEETGLFFIYLPGKHYYCQTFSPNNEVTTPTPISEENVHAVVIIFHEKMAHILKKKSP